MGDDVDHVRFGEDDALALQDFLLTVERQMIFMLADDDLRGKAGTDTLSLKG